MDGAQVRLQGGQRDRRDVLRALEVDHGSDQVEVVTTEGERTVQGGGALEVALGAGGFDGVKWISRVDRPVRALDSLRRIEELVAGPGVGSLALDGGRPERGHHVAAGVDGLDVTLAAGQEIAVGFLGDVPEVVDEGEGTGDRTGREVEHVAPGLVLHHRHHQLEPGTRSHRKEAGGVPRLGIDRPEEPASR